MSRRVPRGQGVRLSNAPKLPTRRRGDEYKHFKREWGERLDARTPIDGLWLTGQDTITCAQPIVQGAGLITAFRVLGLQKSLRDLGKTLPPILRSVGRTSPRT